MATQGGLRIPERGPVVYLRFRVSGFRVATDVDAHQPSAGSATNNLANFADHIPLLRREMRRTCGTRGRLGLVLVAGYWAGD